MNPEAINLTLHLMPQKKNEALIIWEADVIGRRVSTFRFPYKISTLPLVIKALDAAQQNSHPPTFDQAEQRQLNDFGFCEGNRIVDDIHQRVGCELYNALINDPEGLNALSTVRNHATASNLPIAYVLCFPPSAINLALMPWELLWDEFGAVLLSRGKLASCVRYLDLDVALPPLVSPGKALRILAITPNADMSAGIRQEERQARITAWSDLIEAGIVEMEELSPATVQELVDRIHAGPTPDVIHFYGHGRYRNGQGVLLFDTPGGGKTWKRADQLAALLGEIKLVMLHACQSSMISESGFVTGVAPALCIAGVTAIVAMQLTMRIAAATRFAGVVYRSLARGESLQRAVSLARQALYVEDDDGASWYVPTLTIRTRKIGPLYIFQKPLELNPPVYPVNIPFTFPRLPRSFEITIKVGSYRFYFAKETKFSRTARVSAGVIEQGFLYGQEDYPPIQEKRSFLRSKLDGLKKKDSWEIIAKTIGPTLLFTLPPIVWQALPYEVLKVSLQYHQYQMFVLQRNPLALKLLRLMMPLRRTQTTGKESEIFCRAMSIDFGTTYSVIAIPQLLKGKHFIPVGDITLIRDDTDQYQIPSVVAVNRQGKRIAGQYAKNMVGQQPEPIMLFKGAIGKEDKPVKLDDQLSKPEDVLATMLTYLKRVTEKQVGHLIEEAVITVPAHFTKKQKQKIEEAGEMAELKIIELLEEPVAATLRYYRNDTRDSLKIMTYDLGGGTFEVAIVEKQEDDTFRIKCFDWSEELNGHSFDRLLALWIIEQLNKRGCQLDIHKDSPEMSKFMIFAEEAKITLSKKTRYTLNMKEYRIFDSQGKLINIRVKIMREHLERLIGDSINKTIDLCDRVLKEAMLKEGDINQIILIGGCSRIPLVEQRLAQKFGHQKLCLVEPESCVAIGGAIRARQMGRDLLIT